jgi:hypothetical protein
MGSDILANLMFPTINAGLSHLSSPSFSSAYSSASTSCASPEEVDIVFLHSAEFGNFPRHCGGPLFWAEREVGLVDILVGLKAMHEAEKVTPTPTTGVDDTSNESSVFEPCTLLVQVVQSQSSLKEDLFFRNNSK